MKRVGIVTDRRVSGDMPVHQANDEYVVAVRDGAGALPLLIPSTDTPLPLADVLAAVDGLLFTGSPSNVAPPRYGAAMRAHACWMKRAMPPPCRCCWPPSPRASRCWRSAAASRN